MAIIDQTTITKQDLASATILLLSVSAALCLIFLFYVPGINQSVSIDQLPNEVQSLKLHITSYCLSYSLFVAGLLLAIARKLTRIVTQRPWIEGSAIIATFFAILGLVFGFLASKPMWGTYWVWDIKLISTLFVTAILIGISIVVIMTRLIADERARSISLLILFMSAVAVCITLYLAGRVFRYTIHPQWFPEMLFR